MALNLRSPFCQSLQYAINVISLLGLYLPNLIAGDCFCQQIYDMSRDSPRLPNHLFLSQPPLSSPPASTFIRSIGAIPKNETCHGLESQFRIYSGEEELEIYGSKNHRLLEIARIHCIRATCDVKISIGASMTAPNYILNFRKVRN